MKNEITQELEPREPGEGGIVDGNRWNQEASIFYSFKSLESH